MIQITFCFSFQKSWIWSYPKHNPSFKGMQRLCCGYLKVRLRLFGVCPHQKPEEDPWRNHDNATGSYTTCSSGASSAYYSTIYSTIYIYLTKFVQWCFWLEIRPEKWTWGSGVIWESFSFSLSFPFMQTQLDIVDFLLSLLYLVS